MVSGQSIDGNKRVSDFCSFLYPPCCSRYCSVIITVCITFFFPVLISVHEYIIAHNSIPTADLNVYL